MNWNMLRNPALVTAAAALSVSAISLQTTVQAMHYYLKKLPIQAKSGLKFHTLPVALPGWTRLGQDPPPLAEDIVRTLGTPNYITRTYVQTNPPEGQQPMRLELHCAYYTGTIDTVPHVPERCFVGGGMIADGASRVLNIPLDLDQFPLDPYLRDTEYKGIRRGRTMNGVYVHMPRKLEELRMNITPFKDSRGGRALAGYFFLANGGSVPTADDVRLLAFQLKDSYAYYAKVQVTSSDVQTHEQYASLVAEFLDQMLPEIMLRTPDWVEVLEGRYPADNPKNATRGSATMLNQSGAIHRAPTAADTPNKSNMRHQQDDDNALSYSQATAHAARG